MVQSDVFDHLFASASLFGLEIFQSPSGTDIAKAAGQMVLMGGSPSKAVDAILLSRLTFKTIKQNLFWAFGYNIVGLTLAAFGFVHPLVAGFAMALSSISVLLNSLRVAKTHY